MSEKSKKMPEADNKVDVKVWRAVATWSWELEQEECPICRTHLMEPCIDCQANQNSAQVKECGIAWGRCNHAFHHHCIGRWLKQKSVCPLCNAEWEYEKFT